MLAGQRSASIGLASVRNDHELGATADGRAVDLTFLRHDGAQMVGVSSPFSVSHREHNFADPIRFGKALVRRLSLFESEGLCDQRIDGPIDEMGPNVLDQAGQDLTLFFGSAGPQQVPGQNGLFGHESQEVNRAFNAALRSNNHPASAVG